MLSQKATARTVGVLFILASVTAVVGGSLLLPLDEPDYLTDVDAARVQMLTGALLELVLAVSVFAIAALLYPILRREDEGLALGYLGTRIVEGVLLASATVSALVVVSFAEAYAGSGGAGVEPVGEALLAAREWTYFLGSMLVFGASAVLLNTLLYRSGLVPAWLSLWGLVGAVVLLARAGIELFGAEQGLGSTFVWSAPIAVQEMVFAVWLIVKGFHVPVPHAVPDAPVLAGRP